MIQWLRKLFGNKPTPIATRPVMGNWLLLYKEEGKPPIVLARCTGSEEAANEAASTFIVNYQWQRGRLAQGATFGSYAVVPDKGQHGA